MPKYKNLSGRSGVDSYTFNRDGSITVFFKGGGSYTYSGDVEHLDFLADSGIGLNRFLTRNKPAASKKRRSDRVRATLARLPTSSRRRRRRRR